MTIHVNMPPSPNNANHIQGVLRGYQSRVIARPAARSGKSGSKIQPRTGRHLAPSTGHVRLLASSHRSDATSLVEPATGINAHGLATHDARAVSVGTQADVFPRYKALSEGASLAQASFPPTPSEGQVIQAMSNLTSGMGPQNTRTDRARPQATGRSRYKMGAHGLDGAKLVPRNHLAYKTAPCRHWTKNNGWCPLGEACCFIHDDNLKWVPATADISRMPSPSVSGSTAVSSFRSSPVGSTGGQYYPSRRQQKTTHCWAYVQGRCQLPDCQYIHPADIEPYKAYTPCASGKFCVLGRECPFKHMEVDGLPRRPLRPDSTVYFVPDPPPAPMINGTVYYPLPTSTLLASVPMAYSAAVPDFLPAPSSGLVRISPPPSVQEVGLEDISEGMLPEQPAAEYWAGAATRDWVGYQHRMSVAEVLPVEDFSRGAGHTRRASESVRPTPTPFLVAEIPREELCAQVASLDMLANSAKWRKTTRGSLQIATDRPLPHQDRAFPQTASTAVFPTIPRNGRGHAKRFSVTLKQGDW
ncbi:hypothetical protein FA95DRAFT_1562612 [Auriscalpium vulgare]|uniref:Uncharacterized protein n=1 Tax=Auriscalpium vulgare TaxID=40419 RepID=A0ACB8RJV1_9AGAM|nr:hypothetical protein FA95DRAFT_1562612 [Auriscalpium vulgare]